MAEQLGIIEEIRRAAAPRSVRQLVNEANSLIVKIRWAKENVARVARETELMIEAPDLAIFKDDEEAVDAMYEARWLRDRLIIKHKSLMAQIAVMRAVMGGVEFSARMH